MRRVIWVLLMGLAAASCNPGNQVSSVPTTPTPTPSARTETFTGTVEVAGRAIHPFTVAVNGSAVSVNLATAGPPATIVMGLGVGSLVGTTCTLLTGGSVQTPAGSSAQLAGTLATGSYCLVVFDIGNQTAQIAYSVSVTHF